MNIEDTGWDSSVLKRLKSWNSNELGLDLSGNDEVLYCGGGRVAYFVGGEAEVTLSAEAE